MRSSGRLRSRPVRSVSRQSSASTVPMPVRMASESWRSCCTCARARSLVIQPRVVFGRGDLAVQRERGFQRHQRPSGAHGMQEGFVQAWRLRRRNSEATSTSMPASRKLRKPSPATSGLGSSMGATTRATPACISASAQGGVRPWCEHGSRLT